MTDFDPDSLVRDYGDVEEEVRACRGACALFDFSFMARARVSGPAALELLERFQARPIAGLAAGRLRYGLRIDGEDAVLADLTVWNLGGGVYEVMSGRRADMAALARMAGPETAVEDLTEGTAVFAVQGPGGLDALAPLTDAGRLAEIPYFGHRRLDVGGIECRIGRLGYTGERGFELIAGHADGEALWRRLAERARPAGFAAADCLRIEAGFILFVNECRFGRTAAELGLGRFAGVGRTAPRFRLICFTAETATPPMLWRPEPNAALAQDEGRITVTSACHSPLAGGTLGLGLVAAGEPGPFTDPAGAFHRIREVSLPFFDPDKARPRGPWSVKSGI